MSKPFDVIVNGLGSMGSTAIYQVSLRSPPISTLSSPRIRNTRRSR
ncbi:hypothetical protein [Brevibacillus massiliensis]|nr:hypothetical protein [Brevibacillus massiliensis]